MSRHYEVDPGYAPGQSGAKDGRRKQVAVVSIPDEWRADPAFVNDESKSHGHRWTGDFQVAGGIPPLAHRMRLTDDELARHGLRRIDQPASRVATADSGAWGEMRREAVRLRRDEGMTTRNIVKRLNGPSRTVVNKWLRREGLGFSPSEAQTRRQEERFVPAGTPPEKVAFRDMLVRMAKAGIAPNLIAERTRIHQSVVEACIAASGAEIAATSAEILAANVAEVKRLGASGHSAYLIAERLNLPPSTVYRWLRGVTPAAEERRGRSADERLMTFGLELIGEGESRSEAARLCGVSRQTISNWERRVREDGGIRHRTRGRPRLNGGGS